MTSAGTIGYPVSCKMFCSEPQECGTLLYDCCQVCHEQESLLELDLALLDQRLHTEQDKAKGKALHGTSAGSS